MEVMSSTGPRHFTRYFRVLTIAEHNKNGHEQQLSDEDVWLKSTSGIKDQVTMGDIILCQPRVFNKLFIF